MYDESKKSWSDNIIFSYNYSILGADFSNMRFTFKTRRGVVLKEGPEQAEENIHLNAGRSGVGPADPAEQQALPGSQGCWLVLGHWSLPLLSMDSPAVVDLGKS